ncbi:unnamed protein product [Candida verbasci]|uniref:Uncharacterized protein n=1 Tax=Candida verbasci TaxID=1227364 RepID=A0A9W4TUG9_9ASCO|nr:unnamed protein product [Candida verbasci]
MINSEAFIKNSPFKITHSDASDNYNLTNSTPELIKFQLKLNKSNSNQDLNSSILQDSFSMHLKNNVVPSLSSSTSTLYEEDDVESFVYSKSTRNNYLNLKILIENSVFDSSKLKDSIISLKEVHEIKNLIEEKKESKEYLLNKVSITQQFINDIVNEELDQSTLTGILKTQSTLNQQLQKITQELEELTLKLSNHNLSCLALGYIEDVKIMEDSDTPPSSVASSPRKTHDISDSIFSHLAHIAAQRDIVLPQPTDSKIIWLQQCIDTILNTPKATKEPIKIDKSLQEYKTALNDLRFSYQYLSKEYEISRDSSAKLIQEYRKKISQLESPPPSSSDTLESKDQEISRLRKELSLLKIDKINSPEESVNNTLRKEFKKIVTDLQDQYELELTEERMKCRKLQQQLNI